MAYPTSIDSLVATKTNSTPMLTDHPSIHNAMATAIMAIENELGINPSGSDATVAARLAALGGGVVTPVSYGAVGLGAANAVGSISSGSRTLTITGGTNNFVAGQRILVRGAGANGASPDATLPDLCGTIQTVVTNTITLTAGSPAAGTTVTGAKVLHDDTPAIQAALDANQYVYLAPIPGGYGVNSMWGNPAGATFGIAMPANRTLQGCGYPGRLVREDSYIFGPPGARRLITDQAITGGGGNLSINNVYIDGNLQEVLTGTGVFGAISGTGWPNTTVATTMTFGVPTANQWPTSIVLTDASRFPSGATTPGNAASIALQRDDGTWAHGSYTGKTGNTLTGVTGISHDTSNSITAGNLAECDVGSQQYQCILIDGARTDLINGLWIDNLTVRGWPGTTIRPKNVTNFRLAGSNLIDVHRGPIECTDSCSYGLIENNVINGAFDDGLDVNGNIQNENNGEEAHHISIIGNIIRQFDDSTLPSARGRIGNTSIKVSGLQHGVIANNTVEGGQNTAAILAWDSDSSTGVPPAYAALTDILIEGNEVHGSMVHGIRVRSFEGKNITIRGNLIDSPEYCGIMIEPKTPDETPGIITDLTITNNDIYDPGVDTRTVPPSNQITGIFKNGIRLDGAGCMINRATISNNKVVRARAEAFLSKVDGNDFQIDNNEFYASNWLGVSGTNVMHMASGAVQRFTLRNNKIVNGVGPVRIVTTVAGDETHNEVQYISLPSTVTGDTFTITYAGQTTASLGLTTTAAQLQTALENLSNLAPGDVVVTTPAGATGGGPFTVTFGGTLANTDVALMTGVVTRVGTWKLPQYAVQLRGTAPSIWTEGYYVGMICYPATMLDAGGVVLHDQIAPGPFSVTSDQGLHKATA